MAILLKILGLLVLALISFYWAGDLARQNPKIDRAIGDMEFKYGAFNSRLKDAKIIAGLKLMQRFYLWGAGMSALIIFIFGNLTWLKIYVTPVLSIGFLACAMGYASIRWCLHHDLAFKDYLKWATLIILSPLFFTGIDLLAGNTEIMRSLAAPFQQIAAQSGWSLELHEHPLVIGMVMSGIFFVCAAIYYIIGWLLCVPVAFCSLLIAAAPVVLARFIYTIAPRTSFIGFTFVLFVVVSIALYFL